ncbi:MAG: TetR/AcrR family transcriptional regulator [Anaerolineales bacterium]|nr:TetR/AcrR family transcriptional regulator [Anaerolineales bacterium]
MSINQSDLRVIKTKRGLREAFIRLLLEKGYDAVSIQDIATEAEAARVTFYRHYKNKEELLVDCIDVIYEDIAKHSKQVSNEEVQQGFSPTLAFYQQIQGDGEIYRLLSSSQAGHLLMKRLTELVAERIRVQLEVRFSTEQLLAPFDIIAFHIASAQIGLANWWIENAQPYPPEYMSQISFWLSLAGSARAFGLEKFPIGPPEIPEKMG